MKHSRRSEIEPETGIPHHTFTRHVPRKTKRSIHPRIDLANLTRPGSTTLFQRACAWCLPWGLFTYPGHGRGLQALLGRPRTLAAISYWKRKDWPPAWAATAIRDHIARRCEVGLRLVSELDAYIARREAEVRHQPGALKRRPDE